MKSRISLLTISALSALALSWGASESAFAQPHGAGGPKASGQTGPEPAAATIDSKQTKGTVAVLVVAGRLDAPISDVEVTLSGPSGPMVGQTDVDGTVRFTVSPNDGKTAKYKVSATVKGVTLGSEMFGMTAVSGVSVLMTTRQIGPGRGGRPSTRMMSGRARPEQNDPSGTLTVRAVLGELEQSEFGGLRADIPTGSFIHLVGMHADGSMTVQSKEVLEEKEGRVTFKDLARDNSIAYYAMATFKRAGGTDRLMTQVLKMPPQIGSRMMFAGKTTMSAAPGIDDLVAIAGVDVPMPKAGSVVVQIFAEGSQGEYFKQASSVELIEIGDSATALKAATAPAPPRASTILGESGPMKVLPGTEAGQVSFYAARPSTNSGVAGVSIRVELASPPTADSGVTPTALPASITTDTQGNAKFTSLVVGTEYVAIASLYGKDVRSETFTVSDEEGLSFAFAFQWQDSPSLQAEFDSVPHGADKIYIARVLANGRTFLSMPFQMTADRGAAVGVYMYPELLFSLHGGAELDDKRMWFQTQISIANPGIAPLRTSDSGLSIPLPKGFLGASVADEMASRVGVIPDEGFLWRGAVPPGQQDFIASFALSVEGGAILFDMALPYGLRGGRIVIDDLPGMELRTPGGAEVNAKVRPNGRKFLEMSNIEIGPNQRLKFAVRGLPQHSKWHRYGRYLVGITVVGLFLWAGFTIFFGRKSDDESDSVLVGLEATREKLLEQMVALETEYRHARNVDKEKPYKKQRDRLNTRLVDIYRKIDEHKSGSQNAN